MKKMYLDDFASLEKLNQGTKRQLLFRSNRKNRDRKRNSAEVNVLLKAMLRDVRRQEEEGVIKKYGRVWKYNI